MDCPVIESVFSVGYTGKKVATTENSIPLKAGEISILVGNNGAGKTTFLKTVCGSLPPIVGVAPTGQKVYLPEELGFPPLLTSHEILSNLFVSASLVIEAAILFGIPSNTPYQNLSKGNKQKLRVLIAEQFATLTRASILCLDEPLSGLDTLARQLLVDVWNQKRHLPSVFSNPHRIVSMHTGEAPTNVQTIVVDGGKIRRLPPISNCDTWMAFASEHGIKLSASK